MNEKEDNTKDDNTKDEVVIRNLVENWASSVRRKDLSGILRNHSSSILIFDVPPPLQSKGIEAYKRTWDTFFSWTHDPVVFDISHGQRWFERHREIDINIVYYMCKGTVCSITPYCVV